MRRRTYMVTAGAVATLLAGCLSDDDTSDAAGDEGTDPDELDPEAAVKQMLEVDDIDSLAEAVHSKSPLHPDAFETDGLRDLDELSPEEQAAVAEAMRGPEPPDAEELEEILESDWEFEVDEDGPTPELESFAVISADVTKADILDLEYADFWFAETDLDSILESEVAFIVDVELSQPEEDDSIDPGVSRDEPTIWLLVSEDDELRYFWAGEEDTTPENREEAFEEEIIDENDDVVEEIDWDHEPIGGGETDGDDGGQENQFEEVEQAQIHLTDSPGIEAEIVRAKSVIAGGEISFWEPEDMHADDTGYVPGGWADSWIAVQFDPDGDQIVVIAVTDDKEEIVHRETYEP